MKLIVTGKQEHNALTLFWHLTNYCNYNCHYCKKPSHLYYSSLEHLQEINNYADKIRTIILFGGEPTFHPKIKEIIKNLKVKDIRIWTNLSRSLNFYLELDLSKISLNCTFHADIADISEFIKKLDSLSTFKRVFIPYSNRINNIKEIYSIIKPHCDRCSITPIVGIPNYYTKSTKDYISEKISISVTGDINKHYDEVNSIPIFKTLAVKCDRNFYRIDLENNEYKICNNSYKNLSVLINKPIMCFNQVCHTCYLFDGVKSGLFKLS